MATTDLQFKPGIISRFDWDAGTITELDPETLDVISDGIPIPPHLYAARDAAETAKAESEARVAAEVALAAETESLIEVARDLRDDLAVLVMTPVANRDPALVTALVTEGIVQSVQTIGQRDPELIALATECGNLAQSALMQRLAYEAAQP